MIIRLYQSSDLDEIAALFYQTVHVVNAVDYTKEQLDVWATGQIDKEKWNTSLLNHYSIVVVEEDKIIGFGDIEKEGYLDRLYVHASYQGQGVATLICDQLEKAISTKTITTHASITAMPFFKARGYEVVKRQEVEKQGVRLINYIMKKRL